MGRCKREKMEASVFQGRKGGVCPVKGNRKVTNLAFKAQKTVNLKNATESRLMEFQGAAKHLWRVEGGLRWRRCSITGWIVGIRYHEG